MVRDPSFHGGGDAQRLVNAAKIVMHEVQSHGVFEVFNLLAEAFGKAGEATHAYAHSQILALDVAS